MLAGEWVVSSRLVEIEAFRAVDRERLLGGLTDSETAVTRKELIELLAMMDLVPVDDTVIDGAKASFAVNLRAIDAIPRSDGGTPGGIGRRATAGVLDT